MANDFPPVDIRICKLVSELEKLGIDPTNPRVKQKLQDLVINLILEAVHKPQLVEMWDGVLEIAEQMGYPKELIAKCLISLPNYVATFGFSSRKERRLCNGTLREINLYLVTDEVKAAIAEFLSAKILTTAQDPELD